MPRLPNWLFYVVTLTITSLWMVGITISFFSPKFTMPPQLSGIMPFVLTALFGLKSRDGWSLEDGDDDEEEQDHDRRDRRRRRR